MCLSKVAACGLCNAIRRVNGADDGKELRKYLRRNITDFLGKRGFGQINSYTISDLPARLMKMVARNKSTTVHFYCIQHTRVGNKPSRSCSEKAFCLGLEKKRQSVLRNEGQRRAEEGSRGFVFVFPSQPVTASVSRDARACLASCGNPGVMDNVRIWSEK